MSLEGRGGGRSGVRPLPRVTFGWFDRETAVAIGLCILFLGFAWACIYYGTGDRRVDRAARVKHCVDGCVWTRAFNEIAKCEWACEELGR